MNLRNPFRRWQVSVVGALMLTFAMGSQALANLPGSSFEGSDGNLVVSASGSDWENAPNRVRGDDRASGASDNSFGQGTKEDGPNVTVVSGSIPPNKSDLTRFYIANEYASAGNFLYLAWERSNVLGSANIDFEINKNVTSGFSATSSGPLTLNRTAGDLLVTFDFTSGGGKPVLGLLRWVTSGATGQCFSSNSLPCWGNRVDLSGLNEAEGAVNAATVTDPIAGVSLPGLTFGEAAVNLTAAGVFPPGSCTAFGSAMVKSRSSASFTAEVKDFIAPQPVNISNCGTIAIHKVTENGDSTFGYTTSGGLSPATFTLSNGGTRSYAGVAPGSYGVTESPLPSGWTLESLNCTSTGSGTSVSAGAPTASITMAPGGTVDCTYTNHTNASPTIGTTLSATTVSIGTPVHDSSTLSGATAGAGGTVTYTVYANSGCTQGAQGAGTRTVTSGVVPDSDPITFGSAGTYYWQAVYSGDADNNPATSPCIEEQLTVSPNSPGISTAQNLLPNDSATIAGATSTAGGTITFSLYGPSDATCAGTPALTQSVGVAGDGTYSTSNTTFTASQVGTWRWKVVYGGDANNLGTTSACGVENFTITD